MKKETLLLIIGILIGFIIGYLVGEKKAEDNINSIVSSITKNTEDEGTDKIVLPVSATPDTPKHTSGGVPETGAAQSQQDAKSTKNKPQTELTPDRKESASEPKSNSTVPSNQTNESKTITTNPNALSVVSYVHDWVKSEAIITLKNNTEQTVTGFSARIIYKSMGGDILDYQDIGGDIHIEPHLARSYPVKGYGHDLNYAYYKSEIIPGNPERKYKIEFVLNSITTR